MSEFDQDVLNRIAGQAKNAALCQAGAEFMLASNSPEVLL